MFRDVFEDDAIAEQHSSTLISCGAEAGRPPAWMSNGRQGMSDAARKAASEGMKTYRTKRKETAAAKKDY